MHTKNLHYATTYHSACIVVLDIPVQHALENIFLALLTEG